MKKKLFLLTMLVLCALCITGCKCNKDNKKVTIDSISVIESTIPSSFLISEVEDNLSEIQFTVNKSNGEKETKNLFKSMVSSSDLEKLNTAGTHKITFSYEGVSTSFNITIVDPSSDTDDKYKVKVMYPDGTPVNGGVNVQWCDSKNCFPPVTIDTNGIAKIDLKDNDYYIHIDDIPSGYTYNPNAYTTNAENKYIEIVLLKLDSFSSGDGTKGNPYVVSTGTYTVSYEAAGAANAKYISFTATETKTYNIQSLSTEQLATNEIDPQLYFGFDANGNPVGPKGDVEGFRNFNYSFEATKGETYTIIIFVKSAQSFEATFDFIIK